MTIDTYGAVCGSGHWLVDSTDDDGCTGTQSWVKY